MNVAWFDAEKWEKEYLEDRDTEDLQIDFFERPLNPETVEKARGYDAVAVFVSSRLDDEVLEELDAELIACRSTGFDHVNMEKAEDEGLTVCNVPEYGAATVAEHTFGLMLCLSRKIYEAVRSVEHGNFSHRDLRGFDLRYKTLGVVGTGAIGQEAIRMANGFGMNVVASDPYPDHKAEEELDFTYIPFEQLVNQADIISIHCPLTDENRHMFSEEEFNQMDGTILINTARGELVDTEALVNALENGHVEAAGLDVLEEECYIDEDLEVENLKDECDLQLVLKDHMLIGRDDVLVTPHNAFNSIEAMQRIVSTTLDNLRSESCPVTR